MDRVQPFTQEELETSGWGFESTYTPDAPTYEDGYEDGRASVVAEQADATITPDNVFLDKVGYGAGNTRIVGTYVAPALQEKSVIVTENGATEVTPDAGFGALSKVNVSVNVPPTLVDRTKPILFFDYDGTLLHSYTREEAQALSALPGLPTHDLLTGTGWTYTLEQVKSAQVLHVGAMYRTTDGKTYAFVTLTAVSGSNPRLRFKINGTATIRIDWGDGQTQDISTNSDYEINHTYQSEGDYVITLERISGTGTYTLGNGTSETFIGMSSAIIRQTLTKLYVGDNATISAGAFYRNTSLASVVIPESVTSVEHSPFESCYSLTFVVLPVSLSSTGNGNTFRECRSLSSAVIPEGFTTIGFQTFLNCYSLRSIVIPASVTEIGSGAFSSCFALNEIIIAAETPPTLTSGAFGDGTSIRKMYVPDASVAAYKAAPNWSTLADYIYPMSEL